MRNSEAAHLHVVIFGTELAAQIRAAVHYSLDTENLWVLVNHRYYQYFRTLAHALLLRHQQSVLTPNSVSARPDPDA